MRRTAVLLIFALVALPSCGKAAETVAQKAAEKAIETDLGGDASVDISDDGDGLTLTGTDAETGEDVELQMGGTEVPDDFPMPLPDNAEVSDVSWVTIGEETAYTVILTIDPDDRDDILAFYESWFKDENMEVLRSEDTVIGTGDDATAVVSYEDYGDYGEVGINWSPSS